MSARLSTRLHELTIPSTEGCLLWTGWVSKNGYGPHRDIYEQIVGPVPAGLHLDHLCHRPPACSGGSTCIHRRCVNVAHLEPVTPRDNTLRGYRAQSTHCDNGHLYAETLRLTREGGRRCMACDKARQRRNYLNRKRRRTTALPIAA